MYLYAPILTGKERPLSQNPLRQRRPSSGSRRRGVAGKCSSSLRLSAPVAPALCSVSLLSFLVAANVRSEAQSDFAPVASGLESSETLEDVYIASVETDRGVKEQLRLYDTRGLQDGVELPKHYFSFADGFVLVYSVDNLESFRRIELLKKEVDKFRDKKEMTIVVLGNKMDLADQKQVDTEMAQQWAKSEKLKLWEVTVTDRKTLIEPFILLASKLTQPQSKSTFPLPGRKNKATAASDN